MRIALFLSISLAPVRCATLSKQECLNGNWGEIGFRDGTNGRMSDYLQSHAKACAKSGVVPVQNLWEAGRQKGLPVYCVPSKAYAEGKRGRELRPVCPAAQLGALQSANAKGLEFHELTEEIKKLRFQQDELDGLLIAEADAGKRALLVFERSSLSHRLDFLELKRARVSEF